MSDSPRESRVSVIDAETDPFKFGRVPAPFMWGYWNGESYRQFGTTEELVFFLRLLDPGETIYAHNGGRFDFHYLLPYVNDGEIMILNGRLAKLGIGDSELRDSALILPMPLSAWKKDEVDYAKFERDVRDEHRPEISRYLKNDCIYLREIVMAFRAEFGDAMTLASAALKDCLQRCGLKRPSTSRAYHATYRPWYHGGRTEARGGTWNHVTVYDVNSAYPWAMAQRLHPWGGVFCVENRSHALENIKIVGSTLYKVIGPETWLFPSVSEGVITYDNTGKETTYHVTGHELLVAYQQGWRGRVLESRTPENVTDFAPFVNYHFDRKRKHAKDTTEYILSKLVMNSAYGKLGCNPDNYARYWLCDFDQQEPEGYCFEAQIGNRALYTRALFESEETWLDVATAASIAGAVRSKMAETIASVKRENVVYCDTDSVFLVKGKIANSEELGGWAVEERNKTYWIGGRKLYCNNAPVPKTRCKGATLTPDEIRRVVAGGVIETQRDAPTFSVKSGARFLTRKIRRTS